MRKTSGWRRCRGRPAEGSPEQVRAVPAEVRAVPAEMIAVCVEADVPERRRLVPAYGAE